MSRKAMIAKNRVPIDFFKKLLILHISDAMRPEDDSCTDKVKEVFPQSKF